MNKLYFVSIMGIIFISSQILSMEQDDHEKKGSQYMLSLKQIREGSFLSLEEIPTGPAELTNLKRCISKIVKEEKNEGSNALFLSFSHATKSPLNVSSSDSTSSSGIDMEFLEAMLNKEGFNENQLNQVVTLYIQSKLNHTMHPDIFENQALQRKMREALVKSIVVKEMRKTMSRDDITALLTPRRPEEGLLEEYKKTIQLQREELELKKKKLSFEIEQAVEGGELEEEKFGLEKEKFEFEKKQDWKSDRKFLASLACNGVLGLAALVIAIINYAPGVS